MNLFAFWAFSYITTGGWHAALAPNPLPTEDWQRTVIFLERPTTPGQFIFLRGGWSESCIRYGLKYWATCDVRIQHRIGGTSAHFNAWKANDDLLDWFGSVSWGPNPDQGAYRGVPAQGTPMVWTTDNRGYHANVSADGYGYSELNTWGDHYWMVDLDMDCSDTEGGWFEMKGIGPGLEEWEQDIDQVNECQPEDTPRSSINHLARCGYLNRFTWNDDHCLITELD